MVECESDPLKMKDGELIGFNRYMVECEYDTLATIPLTSTGF